MDSHSSASPHTCPSDLGSVNTAVLIADILPAGVGDTDLYPKAGAVKGSLSMIRLELNADSNLLSEARKNF